MQTTFRDRARGAAIVAALGAGSIVAATAAGFALQVASGGNLAETASPASLAIAVGLLGCLILWRKPWHRMGVLMACTAGAFAVAVLASGLLDYGALRRELPRPLEQAAYAWVWGTGGLVCAWALVILWFPDGRFASRAWRRYFVASTALCIPFVVACYLLTPNGQIYSLFSGVAIPPGIGGPLASAAWQPVFHASTLILLVPLISLAGLVQRFRRADAVVRQQIRWLLWGAAFGVIAQVAAVPFETLSGAPQTIGQLLGAVGQPMVAAGITVGILRYRLWEIDIVVSRAVVFGVVWTSLSLLLLVPALAAGLLVGGASALTAVALALLVTLLFRPATRRLEAGVERLVYRRRAQPHVILTDFWDELRRVGDLDALGDLVAGTVRAGLHVRHAGVWLTAANTLRSIGTTASGAVIDLSPATAEVLRSSPGVVLGGTPPRELAPGLTDTLAALVPLVAGDELVGLLACGERRGDRLGAADFQLLEILGRESAQRLRNLHLEARLRARLEEIEAQAAALRESRQRLVSAQDDERRRIERNLHDGVQQQLVSLAIRLRRISNGRTSNGRTSNDAELADLAVEAEQAVFALQELGRGIFPGVLVDQGLAAALRTQVARMPMAVHIDVHPDVLRRRWAADVEAALYFVALEALTNAQKHAGEAAASVVLQPHSGCMVLEVIDDGVGFASSQGGSGLSNMADRMAAVGGTLSIDSAPGAGTRVAASIPMAVGLTGLKQTLAGR